MSKAKGNISVVNTRGIEVIVEVNKNTYEIKDKLKDMGFWWDADNKIWTKEIKVADGPGESKEEKLQVIKEAAETIRNWQDKDFAEFDLSEKAKGVLQVAENN